MVGAMVYLRRESGIHWEKHGKWGSRFFSIISIILLRFCAKDEIIQMLSFSFKIIIFFGFIN